MKPINNRQAAVLLLMAICVIGWITLAFHGGPNTQRATSVGTSVIIMLGIGIAKGLED